MKKIISCNLMGGLGNQMFQAAHAYAQSLRFNRPCVLLPNSNTQRQGREIKHYLQNIFSKFSFVNELPEFDSIYEGEWYYKNILPSEGNTVFHGYFQSEKNFYGFKDEIIDIFSPSKKFITKILETYPQLNEQFTVSIHVRRGDSFSAQNVHPMVTKNYIDKCLLELGNYSHIFCFSDDKQWVKDNLKYENIIFVDDLEDYEELWMMSICKNNIISNSTFSWWSAYLNKNEYKKVFVPSVWFGEDGPKIYEDIFVPTWTKIEVTNKEGWLI